MPANERSSSTTVMQDELIGLSPAIALVYGEMAILVNGDSYTFIPEWASFMTTEPQQLVIIHIALHVRSATSSFSVLPSVHNGTIEGFWLEFAFQGSSHIDAVDNVYGPNIHISSNSSPAWIQGYSDEGYESDNEVQATVLDDID